MKLPEFIHYNREDGKQPIIIQTAAPYIMGELIVPFPEQVITESRSCVKVEGYNLYIIHAGYFAPSEAHTNSHYVLEQMAGYALEKIITPAFFRGYKKYCEDKGQGEVACRQQRRERKEKARAEQLKNIEEKLFKNPND